MSRPTLNLAVGPRGDLDVLEYLLNFADVDSTLLPYPSVREHAGRLRLSPSKAHPSSEWRVCGSRFGAFLSRASRASSPAQRLGVLEAALASSQVRGVTTTPAEHEFRDRLAELLLIAALAEAGFAFHDLPRRGPQNPDVTGTMPGLGTLSIEVYQPADDASKQAYMLELTDAVELADVPWDYLVAVDWHEDRSRPLPAVDRSHRERHGRIQAALAGLFWEPGCPRDGGSAMCTDCVFRLKPITDSALKRAG